MRRRPPRSTRTDTLCPYTTLFRSVAEVAGAEIAIVEEGGLRRFGIVPIAFEIADRADADLAHLPLRERLALFVEDRQVDQWLRRRTGRGRRSEEHTSELQSLMRISYAVFSLENTTPNKIQQQ